MNAFELDPDVMADQATRLSNARAGLAGLGNLPRPDTGETTPLTSTVLDNLDAGIVELGEELDDLAATLATCLDTYEQVDSETGAGLEFLMRIVLS